MDKFNAYVAAAVEWEKERRVGYVLDTVAAIAGGLSGKGITEYIEELQEL